LQKKVNPIKLWSGLVTISTITPPINKPQSYRAKTLWKGRRVTQPSKFAVVSAARIGGEMKGRWFGRNLHRNWSPLLRPLISNSDPEPPETQCKDF